MFFGVSNENSDTLLQLMQSHRYGIWELWWKEAKCSFRSQWQNVNKTELAVEKFYHVHREWTMGSWRFLALRCVVLWVLEDARCFRGLISITVLRACHNAKRSWVLLWASQHLPCVDHWSQPSFHCCWMPTYQFSLGREAVHTEAQTANSVCRKCWIKRPVISFVLMAHEWQGHA